MRTEVDVDLTSRDGCDSFVVDRNLEGGRGISGSIVHELLVVQLINRIITAYLTET